MVRRSTSFCPFAAHSTLTRLGLVELRRIEAAEVIASDLARSRNVVYLPTGQNLLLNVSGAAQ